MTSARDTLYLLDMLGEPVKSLQYDYDTEVESVLGSHSTLSTSVPFDSDIKTEMQLIYRGERYIISDLSESRDRDYLKADIQAESAYMQLADVYKEIDEDGASIETFVRLLLDGTKWSIGSIPRGIGGRHSLTFKDRESSALATLRLLERLSDGELKLHFDTINYRVSFVRPIEKDAGFLFQYGVNVEGISREIKAPQATVMIPKGNDDMGIESVTEGNVNFVENYDYYLEEGYTIEEARQNFEKIGEFKDERYLIPGNLMREAERRLETLAFPQTTYSTTIAYLDKPVEVGTTGYVQDNDLGIKVKAEVVRVIEEKDYNRSRVELNYLIPGVGDLQDFDGGSSGGTKIIMKQLDRQFNSDRERHDMLFEIDITNISATHLGVGFWFHSVATTAGTIIDGYFDLDGHQTGHIIKQSLVGYDMHGYNFMLTSVPEGSHVLRLMLKSEGGTFTIPSGSGEIYVESEALAGGVTISAPRINYVEDVILPPPIYVEELVDVVLTPTTSTVTTSAESIEMFVGDITTLDYSINFDDVSVSWTVGDNSVIGVVENTPGQLSITGLAVGTTDITITVSDGVTKVVPVTIKGTEIITSLESVEVMESTSTHLNVSINDTRVGYSYAVSDNSIVSVTESNPGVLLVEGLLEGETDITITTTDGVVKIIPVIVSAYISGPVKISPMMTSDTTPEPYVATASSMSSINTAPWKAFDGGRDEYWTTSSGVVSGWLQIDLGMSQIVNSYRITEARELNRNPRDWTLEGSNDGNDWDVLDTRNSETAWSTGVVRQYDFDNVSSYRYYRLNITRNNGNTSFLVIGELELFHQG